MLHYDIYRIICLYADGDTLENIYRTTGEISACLYEYNFWLDKLCLQNLPCLNSQCYSPDTWLLEYHKIMALLTTNKKYTNHIAYSEYNYLNIEIPNGDVVERNPIIETLLLDIISMEDGKKLLDYARCYYSRIIVTISNGKIRISVTYAGGGEIYIPQLAHTQAITLSQIEKICFTAQYYGYNIETSLYTTDWEKIESYLSNLNA